MRGPKRIEGAEEYAQHLTWVTRDREPLLTDETIASYCLAAFERERVRLHLDVFAFVLMPDHVHLVTGPGLFLPGTVVQWMKIASAHWLLRDGLLKASPWARNYWDRAIRDSRQLRTTIEYLHSNPAKAELVANLCEYKFSSYGDYHDLWKSPLKITPAPLS